MLRYNLDIKKGFFDISSGKKRREEKG